MDFYTKVDCRTVGEAATAIDFLDTLQDALWETYGEQITRMHREDCDESIRGTNQCEFELDDDILFSTCET